MGSESPKDQRRGPSSSRTRAGGSRSRGPFPLKRRTSSGGPGQVRSSRSAGRPSADPTPEDYPSADPVSPHEKDKRKEKPRAPPTTGVSVPRSGRSVGGRPSKASFLEFSSTPRRRRRWGRARSVQWRLGTKGVEIIMSGPPRKPPAPITPSTKIPHFPTGPRNHGSVLTGSVWTEKSGAVNHPGHTSPPPHTQSTPHTLGILHVYRYKMLRETSP